MALLWHMLEQRKTALIERLHLVTEKKLTALATQRDQFETRQAQLTSWLEHVKSHLTVGRDVDIIMKKAEFLEQAKEVTDTYKSDSLKPSTKADISFVASVGEFAEPCQNFGLVFSPDLADPSKSHLTCKSDTIVLGKASTVVLRAIDFMSKPCERPVRSLKCSFESADGQKLKCSIERRGRSQYAISYTPVAVGMHDL